MLGFIKALFIRLLTRIVNSSNHAKYIFLGNKQHKTKLTLISCNTLNDLSNRVCVLKKTEVLNLSYFNMITRMHESRTQYHTVQSKTLAI